MHLLIYVLYFSVIHIICKSNSFVNSLIHVLFLLLILLEAGTEQRGATIVL